MEERCEGNRDGHSITERIRAGTLSLPSSPPLFPMRGESALGYLDGTLHDERGQLRHHQIHTFQAGLFQFEDLLFDYGLEGQVRGEQPRSEGVRGSVV